MPGPIAQSVNDAIRDLLMKREAIERVMPANQPLVPMQVPGNMTPIGPEVAALGGGLADAASTYRFLKNGSAHEDNALWGGSNSPAKVAGGVAAEAGILAAARALARRKRGVLEKIANVLAAQQGGYQMGLAANNLRFNNERQPVAIPSSDEMTTRMMQNAVIRK